MDAFTPRSPVEPPFGCSAIAGLRPVGEAVDTIVSRLADRIEGNDREPRYFAEGRDIVNVYSGRRQTPPMARDALKQAVEASLSNTIESLVEPDIAIVGDLIRAIRDAERADPTPPASIMRAA